MKNIRRTCVIAVCATLSAAVGGCSSGTKVTFSATSIVVTPATATLAAGQTQALKAVASLSDGTTQDVTSGAKWTSSDPTIATLSTTPGDYGIVQTLKPGTVTLTATLVGASGSATLTVTAAVVQTIALTPPSPVVASGASVTLTATATLTDGTTQDITSTADWTLTAPAAAAGGTVAAVLMPGVIQGGAPGSVTVNAASGGVTGTAVLNVTAASVTGIAIMPAMPSIAVGATLQMVATATFSDGSVSDITSIGAWSSSDDTLAVFVAGEPDAGPGEIQGVVQGVAVGSPTLTVTLLGVSASTTLTVGAAVIDSIAITPPAPVIAKGTSVTLVATATLSDSTTTDVTATGTWSVFPDAVATVTSPGVVKGNSPGSVTVTVNVGTVTASIPLTITDASLTSLAILPATPSVPVGVTLQLVAIGTFSDATTQDLTSTVAWSSSDPGAATFVTPQPPPGSSEVAGQVTGEGAGQTTITATQLGVTGTTTLAVTSAVLLSIAVLPPNAIIASGTQQAYHAVGTFSDGTTPDITDDPNLMWQAGDATVATLAASHGAEEATAIGAGTSSVTATYSVGSTSVTGEAILNVTAASLSSIAITPVLPGVARGSTLQLTATGKFSDLTSQDLTSEVTWASADPTVVTVSNAVGTNGLATATAGFPAGGMTNVTATLGGIVGTVVFDATAPALVGLTVTPANALIPKGGTQPYVVTARYTDGTTPTVTSQVAWSSSTPSVATLDAVIAATFDGLTPGTTTVTATLDGLTGTGTLNVTPATLISLSVTPQTSSLPAGTSEQLTATGTFTDGTTLDLTSSATWACSDATGVIATVTSGGLVEGFSQSAAPVIITATADGLATTASVTVAAPALVSIAVAPGNSVLATGTSEQLTATGTYSDGSTGDLSSAVVWSSSNITDAVVSTSGSVQGLSPGAVTITAVSGAASGAATVNVVQPLLTAIAVTPAASSIAAGTTIQYTATGLYSDGSSSNLTSQVTWSATNGVTFSGTTLGLATAGAQGTSAITASLTVSGSPPQTLTGTTSLTVSSATLSSIAINPPSFTLAAGTSQQLSVTGTFSDGSTQNVTAQATWQSNNGFATVSGGLVQAVSAGSSTITATVSGKSAQSFVTVTTAVLSSITLSPTTPTAASGTTVQFSAQGAYSDGSEQDISSLVTWASSSTSVASVSNATGTRGLASAVAPGTTTISATLDGVTASTALTVSNATLTQIVITAPSNVVPKGGTLQLSATGFYSDGSQQDLTTQVTWTSTSEVSVSNAAGTAGLATGLSAGATTVTATLSGISGMFALDVTSATLTSIAVTPTVASLAAGTTLQLDAVGTYSDNSTEDLTSSVSWKSSSTATATVSNAALSEGLVKAVAVGTATITASLDGVSGTMTVAVTSATLQSISVSPPTKTIGKGTTTQLHASGLYSDGSSQDLTTQVTWTTSAAATASVSNASGTQGLATGVAVGTATIQAAFGAITGTMTLTVSAATLVSIEITPLTPQAAAGTQIQLAAIGVFSDNSTQTLTGQVTWASSDTTVATVSNTTGSFGLVTAIAAGTTTLTASLQGVTGSNALTVTAATLESISLTPSADRVAFGTFVDYTATALFSDNTTQNVTTQATWRSSSLSTATVSNAAGAQGIATTLEAGTTTISATFQGQQGSTTLTVTSATVTSVAVTPALSTIATGTTEQLHAEATFSDNTVQDVTQQATWVSTNTAVATVTSVILGSHGVVEGIAKGTATISAVFHTITGTAAVAVTNATLKTITVTPANATTALGFYTQYAASGAFSDGTTQDLTGQVTWETSNSAVATIANAGGRGEAYGVGPGSTTVSAILLGVTGTTLLTVTSATLESIAVTVSNTHNTTTVPVGYSFHLTATGTFSGGLTQVLTSQATWSSLSSSTAAVSNSDPGLVTGEAGGSVVIQAAVGHVTGQITLTVSSAALSSITVSPSDPTDMDVVKVGHTLDLTALGTFGTGSGSFTFDVTTDSHWTSSKPTAATVSNVGGTIGDVTGILLDPAGVTITATDGTISNDVVIVVEA